MSRSSPEPSDDIPDQAGLVPDEIHVLRAVEFGHVGAVVRGHRGLGYERRSNSGEGAAERTAKGLQ